MPESRLRPCGGTPVPAEGAGGSCAHAESLATWTPHTGCGVTCPDMRVSALMRHLMCFRAKFRKYPRRQWENNLTSKGILSRKKLVHRAVRWTNAGVCDRLLSILCITIFTQLQMQQEGRGGSGEIAPSHCTDPLWEPGHMARQFAGQCQNGQACGHKGQSRFMPNTHCRRFHTWKAILRGPGSPRLQLTVAHVPASFFYFNGQLNRTLSTLLNLSCFCSC